ncbi:MAG: hypothetical protein AABX36_04665 [Candidatus Thermoplasmatota archaeon]
MASPSTTAQGPPGPRWSGMTLHLFGWIFLGILWSPFAYLILVADYPEAMWGVVCLMLPLTIALALATVFRLRRGPAPSPYGRR